MLRNREYRRMLFLMIFISIIGTLSVMQAGPLITVITASSAAILVIISVIYTRRRYKDVNQLSEYLQKIYGGDYSLDIRDNEEGELSILKNEIYKVTLILSKQTELLKSEKAQLADAISNISHQLKTPLTSMTVMADLLNDNNLEPEKRKEFTKNIEIQLERMEWLLSSLLKLSKIDAGTVPFKKDRIEVERLVRQALKPLLIPMELKEQVLTVEGDASVTFTGDCNWTAEALINVLKNCIEHTQNKGAISIRFSENPLYTEIKVSDNGCGIEKEELPYIFKRFYKGKNAGEDSVGIGLALAKSIIVSQNGDISVMSKTKEGTQFSIKFYKLVS